MATEETEWDGKLFQILIQHQHQGMDKKEHPYWDLGVFEFKQFHSFASFLATSVHEQDLEMFEGEVSNVMQAWGSPDFVCFLLPMNQADPVLIVANDGIEVAPPEMDPR